MKKLFLLAILPLIIYGCASENRSGEKNIRIGIADDPKSLDPRQIRDLISVNVLHSLFEGLYRHDLQGRLVPGAARNYSVSDDGLTYTFSLRDAEWSDGGKLTAEDFAYAWKSALDPGFPAPNAEQLYIIKGAQAAKEGKASPDAIGVRAADEGTLIVELEAPAPYFIELTASYFFFPVNKKWGESLASPDNFNPLDIPTNGPFKLKEWRRGIAMEMEKNPLYWDASAVKLTGLTFVVADTGASFQMFLSGVLDWTGSPSGIIPSDAIASLKAEKTLEFADAACTYWLRFNTENLPLKSANMRRALSYAIDRKSITAHLLQGGQKPAMGVVPPSVSLQNGVYFKDNNTTESWSALQNALTELNLSKDDLPKITLCYGSEERNHKIAQALQQQWKKTLDIDIALEACDRSVFFERIGRQDYHIALGNWVGDISDPVNFLQVFKYKDSPANNTLWENKEYIALLDASTLAKNPVERVKFLFDAEKLLMEEMPVAPLFYNSFLFLKNPKLKNVYFSELGFLDFKQAALEQ